ncbi:N-acetylmuramoyl-L-alanine amidase [Paenibacillus hamazuiensis]|uniref:peptidoglycan recognition protein family protein n=1 Tax=Paenibacillus hamazuiensis TaxID=2936508 RepID=UPI00200BABFF
MQFFGIVIHHSACPSINGKGYDFFISKNGTIIPASEQTDPHYIHICLEGDFHERRALLGAPEKEQLFLLSKLIHRLSQTHGFEPDDIFPHTVSCPGKFFPWPELVISPEDEYH